MSANSTGAQRAVFQAVSGGFDSRCAYQVFERLAGRLMARQHAVTVPHGGSNPLLPARSSIARLQSGDCACPTNRKKQSSILWRATGFYCAGHPRWPGTPLLTGTAKVRFLSGAPGGYFMSLSRPVPELSASYEAVNVVAARRAMTPVRRRRGRGAGRRVRPNAGLAPAAAPGDPASVPRKSIIEHDGHRRQYCPRRTAGVEAHARPRRAEIARRPVVLAEPRSLLLSLRQPKGDRTPTRRRKEKQARIP